MPILKIDNSNIMSSLEKACLKVTSPTGKTIYIKKIKISDMTKEEKDIFWKFCKDPMFMFIGEIESTNEEMKILLKISKL